MRNRTVKRVIFFWILLLIVAALLGDVSVAESNTGRTAADFLHIGLGARAAGFGGAYTAVSEGVASSYWNPAGLSGADNAEVMFSHFAWYQDITIEYGAVAVPINDRFSFGASFTYVNYGTIEGFDASGSSTGELEAYDWSGGLSVGYSVTEELSLGLTGKYIQQKLDQYDAGGPAVDIGAKYRFNRFHLGAAVVNIGPDLTFESVSEKLPTAARLGLSFAPLTSNVIASVEYDKQFNGGSMLRQGVEVGFNERYFVRTGYDYHLNESGRSFLGGMSIGAGVRFDVAEFDYAYTPQDGATSEDLHRFSLLFRL